MSDTFTITPWCQLTHPFCWNENQKAAKNITFALFSCAYSSTPNLSWATVPKRRFPG